MEFNLLRISLTLSLNGISPALLLKLIYGMSSAFAAAFRNLVCIRPDLECRLCRNRLTCAYHENFGQELSSDPEVVKRHQKPPLPFIFTFPPHTEEKENAEDILFTLLLVGRAIPHLKIYINALEDFLNSGCRAGIKSIATLDYHGVPLYIGNDAAGLDETSLNILSASVLSESTDSVEAARLMIVTPMRLKKDGSILKTFDSRIFLTTLLRRISSLSAYYCGEAVERDYRQLSRQAGEIMAGSSNISFEQPLRGETVFPAAGLRGECLLSGIPGDLLQFLILGTYLNIGKGASYGMGNFRLILS